MKYKLFNDRNEDLKTRFYNRFVKLENGCWEWIGTIDSGNGYGRFGDNYKELVAHRVSYLLHKGKIKKGLVIDHLCKNKWCVNPNHLEAVTNGENVLRGNGITAKNVMKTHCPKGHPYFGGNLYLHPKGNKTQRSCRECSRIRIRKRYSDDKEKWREYHRNYRANKKMKEISNVL